MKQDDVVLHSCIFSFGVCTECTEIIFWFSLRQDARSAQDNKDHKAMVKTRPMVCCDSDSKLLDDEI